MSKSSACNKGKALHISQWIKGELGAGGGRGYSSRGGEVDADDEEELELWSAEQMQAKQTEIQRRLSSATRDERGGEVVIELGADTGSVVSSPGDSQRTVVPENVCQKCQRSCDINGNQQSDAFLDMDPDNKWKPSTVSVSEDLSPCEPFGDNLNNNNNNNNHNHTNNNINDDDDNDGNYDDDDDDDDGLELERPYAMLSSSPPHQQQQQQCLHHLYHHQQQTRFSSTTSLDRNGTNRDRSTDSLDRVEFCSTTDYRWPEDYCPVTASCCLPTDEDYDYDASSEEFWGTPNSSTTSPLSVEVNYNEERQNESMFVPVLTTCATTPKKRPARLEPLIEEIESSDNTPSYEFKEIVFGEGQTLLNFKSNGTTTSSKDKHSVDKSSTTKNLFNMLWRTSRSRTKRTCGGESKLGASFIRRRRGKSEKSKQNKEIKLNLIESVYLLLFG